MIRVFCTRCKPEFEVKPKEHSLADRCPCGNVSCNWSIDFGSESYKEDWQNRQPFRINSFDSRGYRIERDGVDITGQGKEIPFASVYGKGKEEDDSEEEE